MMDTFEAKVRQQVERLKTTAYRPIEREAAGKRLAWFRQHGLALIQHRPFRAPHHTISHAGLVGGGNYPRPGEISLAHHSVLFLDELPEFAQKTLEVLRQPLKDKIVTIARAKAR